MENHGSAARGSPTPIRTSNEGVCIQGHTGTHRTILDTESPRDINPKRVTRIFMHTQDDSILPRVDAAACVICIYRPLSSIIHGEVIWGQSESIPDRSGPPGVVPAPDEKIYLVAINITR